MSLQFEPLTGQIPEGKAPEISSSGLSALLLLLSHGEVESPFGGWVGWRDHPGRASSLWILDRKSSTRRHRGQWKFAEGKCSGAWPMPSPLRDPPLFSATSVMSFSSSSSAALLPARKHVNTGRRKVRIPRIHSGPVHIDLADQGRFVRCASWQRRSNGTPGLPGTERHNRISKHLTNSDGWESPGPVLLCLIAGCSFYPLRPLHPCLSHNLSLEVLPVKGR